MSSKVYVYDDDGVSVGDREVRRVRSVARVSQVIDYLFGIVYALFLVRFGLTFAGARESTGFVQFINGVTDPLYAPFRGIVSSPQWEGHTILLPVVVAIIAYGLLHLALKKLLRMIALRRPAV